MDINLSKGFAEAEKNLKSAQSLLLAKYDVSWISNPDNIDLERITLIDKETLIEINDALEMIAQAKGAIKLEGEV
ncbi:hypothetical protein D0907_20930 (plasmid) [Pseudoalteromonas lipolytica]|uniref:Uncharacterized protein n=1 Tax=Pseudoalteromonas lipolytica TaxID=570156 RepID=A0AAD0WEU4_9GAMM|nr:hypothetical protein [Pseudoalteromonas donghaensis]AXV67795.1 hypothetical protein D0907_20930 [Pseudoalteromonas donghaensis]